MEDARATFQTGKTKDLKWRKQQLVALHRMLDENEDFLTDASFGDLKKVGLSSEPNGSEGELRNA